MNELWWVRNPHWDGMNDMLVPYHHHVFKPAPESHAAAESHAAELAAARKEALEARRAWVHKYQERRRLARISTAAAFGREAAGGGG